MGAKVITVLLASLLFTKLGFAQPIQEEAPKPQPEEPTTEGQGTPEKNIFQESFESFAETQQSISDNIYTLSESIDTFFSDERIDEEERNRNRIRVGLATKLDHTGTYTNEATFSTVFVLPRTQRNFQLIVDNLTKDQTEEESDAEATGAEAPTGSQKSATQPLEETIFSAAMRYIFFDSENWKVHLDSGVHVKVPLEPFVKFRIRRSIVAKPWITRLTQTFEWRRSQGFGISSQAVMDRRVAETFLFRFSNKISWLHEEDLIRFRHVLSLSHKITPLDAFTYFAGLKAIDRPLVHLTSYDVGVTYRRKLYQDWLFLETKPVVVFPRAEMFRSPPSLTIKLEVVFGG